MCSQQDQRDENADTCQHICECLVGSVPICYQSRTQNNGSHQCNEKKTLSLWQLFPCGKHTTSGPDVSDGAQHDRGNAEDYESPAV